VDDTRPVTQAVCDFWDNPGKEWAYSESAFEDQDIGGYNYKYENYESDHLRYPDRIMYGSETFALFAWENWELVKKHSYIIGDFVWTGMDYLGESGIGHIRYVETNEPESGFHQPWPWYVSWCGDIDIIGNKKPQSYYRDVVWGESRLEMMVASPVPKGKTARISYWGWYDELNGALIASKTLALEDKYIAEFEVNYTPGELKAIGVDREKIETVSITTAKDASQLVLFPESESFKAHKNSLLYIPVEATSINKTSAK
jgi:beta-galactosidase